MKNFNSTTAVLVFILTIFLPQYAISQSPEKMSYQSVVRNASGELLTESPVGIQITILQGSAMGTAEYVETQSATTNVNGLASLEIGMGTIITGIFADIDWSNGPYFIKTEIDPSGGNSYSMSGTSELLSVPYALYAGNVSGLEAIDEGNGIGYRLIGADSLNYGNIGIEAVDLSYSSGSGAIRGATGDYSTAMGQNTTASGYSATAMGQNTTASGYSATAMGENTTASGYSATAMGENTTASSLYCTAMGYLTFASGNSSTAMGSLTSAFGGGSTAMGSSTIATGFISTAMGSNTDALGDFSTALGNSTTASGKRSTAMGSNTTASAFNSTALGRYNIGGGNGFSWLDIDPLFEIGNGTSNENKSNAFTVLKNGDIGVVTDSPKARIHISQGNDTGLGNNNGYLLLGETNGSNISIDNNEIMAKNNGVATDLNLQIDGGNVKIGGTVYIGDETIRDAGNNALSINAALLPDLDNVNVLGNPTQRWTTLYATNGTINTSDRREKKNIEALSYGLDEVLQMQPVSFNWKNENSPDLKLGLIAQDLMTLIPEVVKSHSWEIDESTNQLTKKELDRLGVYYSDLVPVLIKAIQEQQVVIDQQQSRIEEQGGTIVELKADSKTQTEALNSNTTLMKEMQSVLNQLSQK